MRQHDRSPSDDKEGGVDSRDERFRIVDRSPFDMYFADRQLEKRYLEQSEDQIVQINTRMLMVINSVFLLAHVSVMYEGRKIHHREDEVAGDLPDFVLSLLIIVYLSILLLLKPRRWLYMPALIVTYASIVLFRLDSFLARYSRFVTSCDQRVSLQKRDILDIIMRSGISARGRRNCSLFGSTSILTWLTIIFISPHLFPSLKTMFRGTFSWICVLIICCYHFRPHVIEHRGLMAEFEEDEFDDTSYYYYSRLETFARVSFLALMQFLCLMKKGMLEKSQRKRFIDGVREFEASQKMFLILEYMVPVHFIVRMIQNPGGVISEQWNRASILFINIVDFERHAKRLQPDELLCFLNNNFSLMDEINHSNGVTKIETVSEEYVAAVGVIPGDSVIDARDGHSEILGRLLAAACEIFDLATEDVQFQMGMHTGSCVAGVIGQKLPRFRLFGDTINTAARMMQKGFPGHLQMGEATKAHLPEDYKVNFRGDVEMKGKGLVKTFLLDRNQSRQPSASLVPSPGPSPNHESVAVGGQSNASLVPSPGPSPKGSANNLLRSFSVQARDADSAVSEGNRSDIATTLSLPAWATTPSFRVGKRQRILSFTSRSGARSFVSGASASFGTNSRTGRRSQGSVTMLSAENVLRFEQALAQVQVSQTVERSSERANLVKKAWRQVKTQTGMNLERFSATEENEWLHWFHESQVRKKFTSRIERQMLFFSSYALFTIAMLLHENLRDKDGIESNVWNKNVHADRVLVVLLPQLSIFIFCVWARIRSEGEWFFRNPVGVQRFLLSKVCFILVCMFVIHDVVEAEFRFVPKHRIGAQSKEVEGSCNFLKHKEFHDKDKKSTWDEWQRYTREEIVRVKIYSNWTSDCKKVIPSDGDDVNGAKFIATTYGAKTDYFKPVPGETFCSTLQSGKQFQWSSDGNTWNNELRIMPIANQSLYMFYGQAKGGICFRRLQYLLLKSVLVIQTGNRMIDWKMIFSFWFYFTMGMHSLTEYYIRWAFVPLTIVMCVVARFQQFYVSDKKTSQANYDAMVFTSIDCVLFLFISLLSWMTAFQLERSSRTRFKAKRSLETTQSRVETILHTLMPPRIIEELRESGPSAEPKSHAYERATIAQSDLCGFTKLASSRTPHEVVELIGEIFGIFDDLCDEHDVYKVETRGDGYIAGQAGWPLTQRNSPVSVVHFGLDMIRKVHKWSRDVGVVASCRVGVHTGYCIGGIVGTEMQRYHLFGGLMTVLDLVESTSIEGRVQVTSSCRHACLRQMRQENIRPEALVFEPRKELHLATSKNDIVEYQEVGGPTFLVRRSAMLQHYASGLGGFRPFT